nr:PREDICTED: uncharacterized protein LOC107076744 isoform X1 [Lepisosteus oculatus]
MVFLIFLLFGIFLNAIADNGHVLFQKNITGVLGEQAVLQCEYKGTVKLDGSYWQTRYDANKKKKIFRFVNGNLLKNTEDFSPPSSADNLTILLNITSLEDEKEFTCVFQTEDEDLAKTIYLTVLVRPELSIVSMGQEDEGLDYQSVMCSASNSKPAASISWMISGDAPSNVTSITSTTVTHPNGTVTQTSVYKFPTYLQKEEFVSCMVEHPAFAEVVKMKTNVYTYAVPNMTIETHNVRENGIEYKEVKCTAAAGRPAANITWVLQGNSSGDIRNTTEKDDNTKTVTSRYRFLPYLHEGEEISCVIRHPTLSVPVVKTASLPAYHLSSIHVLNGERTDRTVDMGIQALRRVLLETGQYNQSIVLEVSGNVPHYEVKCIKENSSFPTDMEVGNSTLWIRGPVGKNHAGIYRCQATYYNHRVSVQLEIEVTSFQPVPPSIWAVMSDRTDHKVIECSALNSIPAANISWLLPDSLTGHVSYNSMDNNGTQSVKAFLQIPACLHKEHTITCEIEHPALKQKEMRNITVPPCLPPSIWTVMSDRTDHKVIECSALNSIPAANISWLLPDSLTGHVSYNSTDNNGTQSVKAFLQIPACLHKEHTITCEIEHPALKQKEMRNITVPPCFAPYITVQTGKACEKGREYTTVECIAITSKPAANISWTQVKNSTEEFRTGHVTHQNGTETVSSTFRVPTHLLSGQDIVCVVEHPALLTVERRTIRLPSTTSPAIKVFLLTLKNTPRMLAICEYVGSLDVNITWLLPGNNTGDVSFTSTCENGMIKASSTYEFPFALHEGQNLTCQVEQGEHLSAERRAISVPQYYISSIKVLNKSTTFPSIHGADSADYRIMLKTGQQNQKVVLKVNGNVTTYQLCCTRDGSSAKQKVVGDTLIFEGEVTKEQAGLYICEAAYHNHRASVRIEVEIASEDMLFWKYILILVSSAAALVIIVSLFLLILCKKAGQDLSTAKNTSNPKTGDLMKELTSLVHDPKSPELLKSPAKGNGEEYAELVMYNIVIDIKTTV